jgi:hypothetical protein
VVPPAAPRPARRSLVARLEGLRALAVTVLDAHTDDYGECAACGRAWPCESASVAEHTLAAL